MRRGLWGLWGLWDGSNQLNFPCSPSSPMRAGRPRCNLHADILRSSKTAQSSQNGTVLCHQEALSILICPESLPVISLDFSTKRTLSSCLFGCSQYRGLFQHVCYVLHLRPLSLRCYRLRLVTSVATSMAVATTTIPSSPLCRIWLREISPDICSS